MYTLVELSSKTSLTKRKVERVFNKFGYQTFFANDYNLIIFHNNVDEISKIITQNFTGDEFIKLSLCNSDVLDTKYIKLTEYEEKNYVLDFFSFVLALLGFKINKKAILNE